MIQFHDGLAQDPILTQEKDCNQVKTPESLLNQRVELNYQVEVQDHIHSQINLRKKITCQNVNGISKFRVWSSLNGCAEIESWFPKQYDFWSKLTELEISGLAKG